MLNIYRFYLLLLLIIFWVYTIFLGRNYNWPNNLVHRLKFTFGNLMASAGLGPATNNASIPSTTTFPPTLTETIETISTITSTTPKYETEDTESKFWRSCPEPGKGLESTFVSAAVDGRLGNVVWSYLSVFAAAKRYNLRPIFDQKHLDYLTTAAFNESFISIPATEWLDNECNMEGKLTNISKYQSQFLLSWKNMFRYMEALPEKEYAVFKYSYYVVNTEEVVPSWNALKRELILKDEYRTEALRQLMELKIEYQNKSGTNGTDIEFVAIHVRRTDYMNHVSIVYPGSSPASPKFFHSAIRWLKQTLNKSLVFIAVSDDRDWTITNIVGNQTDVFIGGSSDISNPGVDLAILAACNHTIFAYGTFGLTGALLANRPGGFTIIFDPLNGTITKEMEFGANLPGWRIMDEDGNLTYQDKRITFAYHLHTSDDERNWFEV